MEHLALTSHALRRCAQRNLTPRDLDYILAYGTPVHRTGVTFYVLRRRDLPPEDRRRDTCARLDGAVLLIAADGTLLTAYRNRHAYRHIHRKLKQRLPRREIG